MLECPDVIHFGLASGKVVTTDENYIRESILNPTAKIVAGLQPIMPSDQGRLTEQQLLRVITHIWSLTTRQPQTTPVTPPQGGPEATGVPGQRHGGATDTPTSPAGPISSPQEQHAEVPS